MDHDQMNNNEPSSQGNEQPFQNTASNEFSGIVNNFDINKFVFVLSRINKNISAENLVLKKNDVRIDVLNFLKDFLPQEKKMIIDQVIDAFSEKKDSPDPPSTDKQQL